jgi:hypothetical protein
MARHPPHRQQALLSVFHQPPHCRRPGRPPLTAAAAAAGCSGSAATSDVCVTPSGNASPGDPDGDPLSEDDAESNICRFAPPPSSCSCSSSESDAQLASEPQSAHPLCTPSKAHSTAARAGPAGDRGRTTGQLAAISIGEAAAHGEWTRGGALGASVQAAQTGLLVAAPLALLLGDARQALDCPEHGPQRHLLVAINSEFEGLRVGCVKLVAADVTTVSQLSPGGREEAVRLEGDQAVPFHV